MISRYRLEGGGRPQDGINTRLLRKVEAGATLELALGLAIGALSHYRFIAVIGVGAIALLFRRVLR